MLSKEQIASSVVPVFLKACKDQVPNVRFCAVKMLQTLVGRMDSGTVGRVKAVLTELASDQDKDVQYYAKKALSS